MIRVGVDVGGTKIHAVLLDEEGDVLDSARLPTGRGAGEVLDGVLRAVDAVAAGQSRDELSGVGVGIPGAVDPGTGTVLNAVNLGVAELELGGELAARLEVPVRVENDVNAAALGAHHALARAGSHHASLAYLNLGTGVAAGIVLAGGLVRGASGLAGEIGHLPIRSDGEPCICGQRGCVETVASGSALARRWPGGEAPMSSLLEAAEAGDEAAVAVVAEFAGGVGAAVRILALSVDPEVIVLGGGLTAVGDRLLALVRRSLVESVRDVPFLAAASLPSRVTVLDSAVPVAAIGAAIAATTPV